jgi:hypothetical protein
MLGCLAAFYAPTCVGIMGMVIATPANHAEQGGPVNLREASYWKAVHVSCLNV